MRFLERQKERISMLEQMKKNKRLQYRVLKEEKDRLLHTNSICTDLARKAKKSQYTKCGLCFGAFPKIFFNCDLHHLDPSEMQVDIVFRKIELIDKEMDKLDLGYFDRLLLKVYDNW